MDERRDVSLQDGCKHREDASQSLRVEGLRESWKNVLEDTLKRERERGRETSNGCLTYPGHHGTTLTFDGSPGLSAHRQYILRTAKLTRYMVLHTSNGGLYEEGPSHCSPRVSQEALQKGEVVWGGA